MYIQNTTNSSKYYFYADVNNDGVDDVLLYHNYDYELRKEYHRGQKVFAYFSCDGKFDDVNKVLEIEVGRVFPAREFDSINYGIDSVQGATYMGGTRYSYNGGFGLQPLAHMVYEGKFYFVHLDRVNWLRYRSQKDAVLAILSFNSGRAQIVKAMEVKREPTKAVARDVKRR